MTPSRSTPSLLPAAALSAAALLALAGCGEGERGRATGATPAARTTHALSSGLTGQTCEVSTVHDKHASMFPCTACHPTGATFGFAIPYTFPGGTTTAGGTLVRGTATAPTTCSVACHHPKGAPSNEIAWNTPGPLACTSCHATSRLPAGHPSVSADAPRSECERCHDTGTHTEGAVALVGHDPSWSDSTVSGFHAYAANRGLASCRDCHGQDLAGGGARVACGGCHDQTTPTFVSWKVRCILCHGGVDNPSGAPPKATWGNGSDAIRIGAHSAHVASAIAPASDCTICHVKPADALASAHVDGGFAEVTFGGIATTDSTPSWDRSTAKCASTYCHAGPGGSNATPTWTNVGAGEAACGACHALPPAAPHPAVGTALTGCGSCHGATMNAAGAIIPPSSGGKHLDGAVQASGHPDAWMDTSSDGFHAREANLGLAACTTCHGANLDGVGGTVPNVSCATAGCHGPSWRTSCVMCHGGVANQTGAPPKATWGNSGDAVRVGAHSTHVQATAISPPAECSVCHPKPADAFTGGHLDAGPAEVVFGGPAVAQGATPAWQRASATCASTHCHARPGGTNPTPTWTRVGQGEAGCGACHGLPPPAPHPTVSASLTECGLCHEATMNAAGAVIPPASGGKHLDGIVEATGHPPQWMDTGNAGFHAFAANGGLDACRSCHGASLDGAGGIARGCQDCHGASWKTRCVMCHGGVDDQSGAPPATTWGREADPVRVGAHTRHGTVGIACARCHPVPADAMTAGHVDSREVADVTFTGIAAMGPAPAWNRPAATCTSYCHGTTLAGGTRTVPAWTGGPSHAACGTCHGIPPGTGTHDYHYYEIGAFCGDCHGLGYYAGSDPELHVNGSNEVGAMITGWNPVTKTCVNLCHVDFGMPW